ncbi:MAG: hypothetical protein ACI9UJ_002541 [bacterium]
MVYKILIGLSALIALIHLFRMNDTFAKIIVVGLVLSISLSFIPSTETKTTGFFLYILTTLAAIVYGLVKKEIIPKNRIVIQLICIPVFISYLTALFHWRWEPSVLFISVFSFVLMLTSNLKSYKNEIAFLTVLAVEAAVTLFADFGLFKS